MCFHRHDADVIRISDPMQAIPSPYSTYRNSRADSMAFMEGAVSGVQPAKTFGPRQVFGVSLQL